MGKLSVLCLSDGRPGHFNQTRGVLLALEHRHEIDVNWVEVKLRWAFLRPLLKLLFNRLPWSCWPLIRRAYGLGSAFQKPDLIVSTGGNTLYLNIALARLLNSRNIFVGGLRGVSAACVGLNIVLDNPDNAPNTLDVLISPTAVEWLPLPAKTGAETWMMAIGGDSGSYRYAEPDWDRLVDFMGQAQRELGVRWVLTTSRRTGLVAENYLKQRVESSGLEVEAVWYCQAPKPVMQAFLTRSSRVFCTEDSFSMMTEAVSCGRPVIGLRPEQVSRDDFYRWALERLQGHHLVGCIRLAVLNMAALEVTAAGLEPLQCSVSVGLGEELEKYLVSTS
ncbi:ELM1/GtrOC1 family putative glycosyltransferase [Marinobacterium rhizophilum]|uniref:Mitochondrial fission ELM1 family protein n=1 Tax=Marinobacterium rhizophilum TaxID=420402 RepID=A0ABY5HE80_9GAMM|nr:ELM1/GtrOC1 family putative glycosyltransferase [Marinobacterium rhizophilum]UTW10585.1 mitochondrial fission ELM1 family protein [Marinobacterium rhizophilum]